MVSAAEAAEASHKAAKGVLVEAVALPISAATAALAAVAVGADSPLALAVRAAAMVQLPEAAVELVLAAPCLLMRVAAASSPSMVL